MKILVTGGLGAVGAPLTTLLRSQGHQAWVLDREHHHGLGGNYYLRCDVGEYRQVENALAHAPFDLVYHAAAEFGRNNGEDFYETLWRSNAVGTKNMIRLQEKLGFRMVVFSSSEIYGEWDGLMEEDTPDRYPLRQLNDYAITKWVNELQVLNSAARYNTETVTVRLFNTYGPGEPFSEYRSVVSRFVYCALHDLPYTVFSCHHRNMTYIEDSVRTLAAIATNFIPGRVYNIAGSTYTDMKTLSDMILALCGKTDRLVAYSETERHNTLDKRASSERAARELGHKETVPLEEGLRRTVAWQREYYGVVNGSRT